MKRFAALFDANKTDSKIPRGLESLIILASHTNLNFRLPFQDNNGLAEFLKRARNERASVSFGTSISLGLSSNSYGLSEDERLGDMRLLASYEIHRIFNHFALKHIISNVFPRQIIYEGLTSSRQFAQVFGSCALVREANPEHVKHYADMIPHLQPESSLIELYEYIISGTYGINLPFDDKRTDSLRNNIKRDLSELTGINK